jgi:MoxR-like ATPase
MIRIRDANDKAEPLKRRFVQTNRLKPIEEEEERIMAWLRDTLPQSTCQEKSAT